MEEKKLLKNEDLENAVGAKILPTVDGSLGLKISSAESGFQSLTVVLCDKKAALSADAEYFAAAKDQQDQPYLGGSFDPLG